MYREEPVLSPLLDIGEKGRAYSRHLTRLTEIRDHETVVDSSRPPRVPRIALYEQIRVRNRNLQWRADEANLHAVTAIPRREPPIVVRRPQGSSTASWVDRLHHYEQQLNIAPQPARSKSPRRPDPPAVAPQRRVFADGGMTVVDGAKPKPIALQLRAMAKSSARIERPITPGRSQRPGRTISDPPTPQKVDDDQARAREEEDALQPPENAPPHEEDAPEDAHSVTSGGRKTSGRQEEEASDDMAQKTPPAEPAVYSDDQRPDTPDHASSGESPGSPTPSPAADPPLSRTESCVDEFPLPSSGLASEDPDAQALEDSFFTEDDSMP
jgi:hypothetical protein